MFSEMSIDVESEFTSIAGMLGGKRVSDFVGPAPMFNNADFIFPDFQVVAELKCLEEDKIADERLINKASRIYMEALESGQAPVVLFGRRRITTEGFSPEYIKKIIDLYKAPIDGRVKKANKQIKIIRERLNVNNYAGLLIVANNGHSALDPWHGWYLLNELLKQRHFSGINSAIYLSANQRVAHPGSGRDVTVWTEIHRPHLPAIDASFLDALRTAWHSRLTALLTGEGEFQEYEVDLAQWSQLENKKV
jgi:hypothetical protein